MRKRLVSLALALAASVSFGAAGAHAEDAKTLGIVALLANDALNIDVIDGATDAAKAAGWDVKVIDTQASADQANAAMNTFAVQKVDAMFVLAYASELDRRRPRSGPPGQYSGCDMGRRDRARHRGGHGRPATSATIRSSTCSSKVGDNADILALTFHPGKLCIDRGIAFDEGVEGQAGDPRHLQRDHRARPGAERQCPCRRRGWPAIPQAATASSASGRAGTSR